MEIISSRPGYLTRVEIDEMAARLAPLVCTSNADQLIQHVRLDTEPLTSFLARTMLTT